jgi:hypothetical protein
MNKLMSKIFSAGESDYAKCVSATIGSALTGVNITPNEKFEKKWGDYSKTDMRKYNSERIKGFFNANTTRNSSTNKI